MPLLNSNIVFPADQSVSAMQHQFTLHFSTREPSGHLAVLVPRGPQASRVCQEREELVVSLELRETE